MGRELHMRSPGRVPNMTSWGTFASSDPPQGSLPRLFPTFVSFQIRGVQRPLRPDLGPCPEGALRLDDRGFADPRQRLR